VTCTPSGGPLQAGIFYSTTCNASGGANVPINGVAFTWGWLPIGQYPIPPGLTLTPDSNVGYNAVISGTPTQPYPSVYAVYALDSYRQAAVVSFASVIKPALQLSCSSTQGPQEAGVPYSVQCSASGGSMPYTFSSR
jgi:hypothetical protein